MKKILVLGCTGSIGTSTLNIIREFSQDFSVVGLTAHSSEEKLIELSKNVLLSSSIELFDIIEFFLSFESFVLCELESNTKNLFIFSFDMGDIIFIFFGCSFKVDSITKL